MHLLGNGFMLECRLPILSVYHQHAACVTSDLTLAADWMLCWCAVGCLIGALWQVDWLW